MVEQKNIMVHDTTFEEFRLIKVMFQAKIMKEISDNEFILELLECLKNEKLRLIT